MIIIADSGSTKTEWAFVDNNGIRTVITAGINPVHMFPEEIGAILSKNFTVFQEEFGNIEAVYFYGAGCIPSKCPEVSGVLSDFFGTDRVAVHSDLLGAARGLFEKQAGVACILGTGSNSAFYDGEHVLRNVLPLGFILGDEGSGAHLGRRFLGDLLKGLLPPELTERFYREHPLDYAQMIESVYRKPGANRFLAQFCPFLYRNMEHPAVREMVEHSFSDFIRRNLLSYEEVRDLPVSFTGSVAFYFRPQLEKVMKEYGLTLGKIERTPMEGMIRYHTQK